jgi:hypothetical protein
MMKNKETNTHYFYVMETKTAPRGRKIHYVKFEGSYKDCRLALNDYKIKHAEFIYNARIKLGVAKLDNLETE